VASAITPWRGLSLNPPNKTGDDHARDSDT
jgi:hypothetical protein